MPAKNFRVSEEGTYSHIYNKGIEKRTLFNDRKDYEVFLGFLRDYLTPPGDPESAKKEFTVNGRLFRGVPHQPKNYFKKVELIAYSLKPGHFHLLLHQMTNGSLEKFMRSLSTRYSMYFNKKYKRSGPLFQGPYKSIQIKDVSPLLFLTRYFHYNLQSESKSPLRDYSSYEEYLGVRSTPWVNPKVVLAFFEKSQNSAFKGVGGYKNFVEKFEPDQKEKQALEEIIFESESEHLEGKLPELEKSQFELPKEDVLPAETTLTIPTRAPEFAVAFGVFALLLTLGIRNIKVSAAKNQAALPTPSVSGISSEVTMTEEIKPKVVLVVRIKDESPVVNIRKEPNVKSVKIGEAQDGENFTDFTSVDSDWYEIELADGSVGFISARYVEEREEIVN